MPQPLPPRSLAAGVALLLALMAGLLWQNRRIGELEATLAARPLVVSSVKEEVAKDKAKTVTRGPVHAVKVVVVAPDGTKTVTTTRDVASEVSALVVHEDVKVEEHRTETPVAMPGRAARTRYVGLGLAPLDYYRPRLRGGVTLWDRLDVGVAYDTRFAPLKGAVQLEVSWRF